MSAILLYSFTVTHTSCVVMCIAMQMVENVLNCTSSCCINMVDMSHMCALQLTRYAWRLSVDTRCPTVTKDNGWNGQHTYMRHTFDLAVQYIVPVLAHYYTHLTLMETLGGSIPSLFSFVLVWTATIVNITNVQSHMISHAEMPEESPIHLICNNWLSVQEWCHSFALLKRLAKWTGLWWLLKRFP